ncbi:MULTISPECIES: hypothetical protein [unclassified Mycobacterium]|uniref:hypothetical protein n=1 Tax=unclassified Mycobacterium TaxID=2642494 RepID=UPI001115BBF7|nr:MULTISPECIES: hypothetical protein [unclassified Mycobacterium]
MPAGAANSREAVCQVLFVADGDCGGDYVVGLNVGDLSVTEYHHSPMASSVLSRPSQVLRHVFDINCQPGD